MATIDLTVADLVDNKAGDSDDEALFDQLENDESALSSIRETRMQELATELSRARYMKAQSYGVYTEIKEEKDLMDITASGAKFAVVHFFKPDFARCSIMDQHLEALAAKHYDTRFLRINVEHCPFLVTRLKIQMLPCVIAFIDGTSSDRIVGFEGLGSSQSPDAFTTGILEARLLRAGVLQRSKLLGKDATVPIDTAKRKRDGENSLVEEDEDDD
ncbi:MAG: hypothetical protein M1814_002815 [Vezdaea aestivalis]|nr:MAG: hypothetical protein M1814_002815 [Vezdaea aestivalis]